MTKEYELLGGSFHGSRVRTDDVVFDMPAYNSVVRVCGNEMDCRRVVLRYRKMHPDANVMEYQGVVEK